MCLFGFKTGDMDGQGRVLGVVVGEKLFGLACCMGSGIVMMKYSAIQRLMREIRQQKSKQTKILHYNFVLIENTVCRVNRYL